MELDANRNRSVPPLKGVGGIVGLRTHRPQLPATAVRHRQSNAELRRSDCWNQSQGARYSQDHARLATPRKVRRADQGRRGEPRIGLYDGLLIEDNHLAGLGGDIRKAIQLKARSRFRPTPACRSRGWKSIRSIRSTWPCSKNPRSCCSITWGRTCFARRSCGGISLPITLLEASGGVTLDTIRKIAETGVDRISVGALTRLGPGSGYCTGLWVVTPAPRETWQPETRHIGRPCIGSTNWIVRTHSLRRMPARAAVIADHQTAGRGRYGRTWTSRPGTSLLLSLVLDPPTELRRAVVLTAWAAVAEGEWVRQITRLQQRVLNGPRPPVLWKKNTDSRWFGAGSLAAQLSLWNLDPLALSPCGVLQAFYHKCSRRKTVDLCFLAVYLG